MEQDAASTSIVGHLKETETVLCPSGSQVSMGLVFWFVIAAGRVFVYRFHRGFGCDDVCRMGLHTLHRASVVASKLRKQAVINLTKATKKKCFLHETKSDMVLITFHISQYQPCHRPHGVAPAEISVVEALYK